MSLADCAFAAGVHVMCDRAVAAVMRDPIT